MAGAMMAMTYPKIIQGGMGVAVSNWRLARAVSKAGQLGVVSGTFLDSVLVRRLQDGDPGGAVRRALEHFPIPGAAEAVLGRYFCPGGKERTKPYALATMHGINSSKSLTLLTIVANFVEVFLAKEGHDGLVGINYLMKIDLPTLPSLYGSMLAGVDFVLMGAGIPKAIPGILDKLSDHQDVSLKIDIEGASADQQFEVRFSPSEFHTHQTGPLKRPSFLAIVSSSILAQNLAKKSSGRIDGFVVEHHTAGGHNAPPRGGIKTDENGEPIYGVKDECNPEDFRRIGLPFWLAGSCATPEKVLAAVQSGAQGVQVGTAFAYCKESGITDDIKLKVLNRIRANQSDVFTDPLASASGYPFKIVQLEGSVSEDDVFEQRPRMCDLGYLRTAYKREDGSVGFRCPAEPVEDYVKKGGKPEDTVGKKCLCNGLLSTVGYAQTQKGGFVEPPLVTAGKELSDITRFLAPGQTLYSAEDVLRVLLSAVTECAA
jgi:nitronate monooxygenase